VTVYVTGAGASTNFLVWDAAHAARLRHEERVMGRLIGCLPRCSFQNKTFGLPLLLSAEEAALLHAKGVVLLTRGSPPRVPDDAFTEVCADRCQALADQRAEVAQLLTVERQARAAQHGADPGRVQPSRADKAPFQRPLLWPASPLGEPLDMPAADSAHAALRRRVFAELHAKRYWLTVAGAVTFGGDFLLYEGDPARHHATHVVLCCLGAQPDSVAQWTARTRLANSVRKSLLCAFAPPTLSDGVIYMEHKWSGIK